MKHPISPDPYVPTEQEHQTAYLKECLDHVVWSDLFGLELDRRDAEREKTSWDPTERLKKILDRLFRKEVPADEEPWESLIDFQLFKDSNIKHLAETHCGDCTAVATSCRRCVTEDMYDLPSTAIWPSKHEGWALLNDYRKRTEK